VIDSGAATNPQRFYGVLVLYGNIFYLARGAHFPESIKTPALSTKPTSMITIKIVCPCGQKYAFDVEPLNGRLPHTVNCPACNADGTAAGNEIIARSQPASRAPALAINRAAAPPAGAPEAPDLPAAEVHRPAKGAQKKLVLSLVAGLVLVVAGGAAFLWWKANAFPSKEMVLEAVETFSKDPLSPKGKAAGDGLKRFFGDARGANYASVRLFPEFMLGSGADQPENVKQAIKILLAASLAGNLRPQLKENIIGNRPYEGIQQMISTYAQLQAADPALHIPKLDKFVELENKNQLKDYVDDIIQKKNYPTK
jgi:hypothetical protein